MTSVFVISKNGERLMPTTRLGKVRKMLKNGSAVIYKHNPFTIQLTYESETNTQPVELCMDTGYEHIGLSIKSEKKEFVSEQYDLLPDEKKKHDDAHKYRRTRRNNKTRYRKKRFDNRKRSGEGKWYAPSIQNKADRHVDIVKKYLAVAPIDDIYLEMGEFDTMALKAIEMGKALPEGEDYQHGPRYMEQTLRSAVFHRDKHTCQICGRKAFNDKNEKVILHAHHMYYWRGQHGNSMDELITVCEKCHTAPNHKEGGNLWGLDIGLPKLASAAFMNIVRWYIWEQVKSIAGDTKMHMTYGAATKASRIDVCKLEKSHVNDAFSMGRFHPSMRVDELYYRKKRRNNRVLEAFYDAKVIDRRTGKVVKGADLGCGRTNRRESRTSDKTLRIYRERKVAKGCRRIRRQRYSLRPGDRVSYHGMHYFVQGTHCNGTRVMLRTKGKSRSVSIRETTPICHTGGWELYQAISSPPKSVGL